jgi:hypothetical protein
MAAPLNPEYPIYIVSKGRAESRLTARALERMRVPYRIVIEPQELEAYAAVIDPDKILILPFSNLGQGSIPARNWIWQHAIDEGQRRHWIIDDNIYCFFRFNRNSRVIVSDGAIFKAMEEFVDRYVNVPMAGPNYRGFVKDCAYYHRNPFSLNSRIYSCILLDNAAPFRWRGRYNEDTDLSLRFLKSGQCTILFNAFLAGKQPTMTMTGGNTEDLYQADGRLEMAKSLLQQHPDCVKITRKWGRWQHLVDYRPFKNNRLRRKAGIEIEAGSNNFGMQLYALGKRKKGKADGSRHTRQRR